MIKTPLLIAFAITMLLFTPTFGQEFKLDTIKIEQNENIVIDSNTEIIKESQVTSMSKWGYGINIFFGYGTFNQNLQNNFKNYPLCALSFDFEYKKLLSLNFGINYGAHKTKEDITFKNGIWKKNSKAETDILEVLIGAIILDNKRFKMVPFAGIAYITINARKPSPYAFELNPDHSLHFPEYSKPYGLDNSAYVLGLTLNLKKNRPDISEALPHDKVVKYEIYFKLKYAYYLPKFQSKHPDFEGNIHSLSIGLGGIHKRVKSLQ
ncbi:MAG: hypothetical protein ACI9OE_001202 [Mariniflexile sp.]|jgi:hypothetical protein